MQHLTPKQRANEWREAVVLDSSDDPENILAAAAELAAEKGLTIGQKVGRHKKKPVTLMQRLYEYARERELDANDAKQAVMDALRDAGVEEGNTVEAHAKVPDVRYWPGKTFYSQDPDGDFSPKTDGLLDHVLEHAGLSSTRVDGVQSEIGRFKAEICQTKKVFWAGELAGYKVGIHTFGGKDVLVTHSFALIPPRARAADEQDFHLLHAILGGMLGKAQLLHMLCELK